jgi:sugar phosphate isomerase/epimerase
LGACKVVLGSNHARNIPDGYPEEQAYAEFIDLCRRVIAPIAAAEDVCVVIEPLRRPASNFIITVADGLRVVAGADHPYIQVLADTIHMLTSGESPDILAQAGAHLRHIHVSDFERALPEDGYSSQLLRILNAVVDCGYRDTISFESQLGRNEKSLFLALNLLKQKLGA